MSGKASNARVRKKYQAKQRPTFYARAARNSITVLLRAMFTRELTPGQFAELAKCYCGNIRDMSEAGDVVAPFLDRAMSKALDQLGIEDYETAFEKALEDAKERQNQWRVEKAVEKIDEPIITPDSAVADAEAIEQLRVPSIAELRRRTVR